MKTKKFYLWGPVIFLIAFCLVASVVFFALAEEKQFDGKKVLTKVEFPKRIAGDQFGTTRVEFEDGTFKILPGIHPLLGIYKGEVVKGVEAKFENNIWVSYITTEPK